MTRTIEIDGKTVTLETGKAPAPRSFGRPKGAIRLLCEQMKDGESAFVPTTAERIQSANLHSIGKMVGAKFAYRTEGKGVRIFRLGQDRKNVTPLKEAAGW